MTKPDPTNPDRLPFGELDRETQLAMFEAAFNREQKREVYSRKTGSWSHFGRVAWWPEDIYRIPPLTPPSINWEHVSERYNVLTCEGQDTGELWEHTPDFDNGLWVYGGNSILANNFASFDPGTETDRTKRIAYRPGYKEGE